MSENFKTTLFLIAAVFVITLTSMLALRIENHLTPEEPCYKYKDIAFHINYYTYETADTFCTSIDTVAIDTTVYEE